MNLLAENQKIKIVGKAEKALLVDKRDGREVVVGDFYGDPQVAIIDKKGRFCAVGGSGLIIYYLNSPYESYSYEKPAVQWKEIFRDGEETWIDNIRQIDDSTVQVDVEFETIKNSVCINTTTGQIEAYNDDSHIRA